MLTGLRSGKRKAGNPHADSLAAVARIEHGHHHKDFRAGWPVPIRIRVGPSGTPFRFDRVGSGQQCRPEVGPPAWLDECLRR